MKLIRISAVWCTSCILTYSIWNDIKNNYPNLEYEELDYDTDDIDKYNVGDTLPVIIIYDKDREINRIIGEKSKKDIEKILKELGC